MTSHIVLRHDDPPAEPPVDDGPEDTWGGWRTGSVWSGRAPISWSDGPPETAGDDNCLFATARLIAVAACLTMVALKLLTRDDRSLAAAHARYKAGACAWEEVRAAQDALLPRCAAHGVPTSATISGRPMCARCIEEAGPRLKLWLKSQALVSGGVWMEGE